MDPNMTTVDHPEADGQVKTSSRRCAQYLQLGVRHKPATWLDFPPRAEYVYHTTVYWSFRRSPGAQDYTRASLGDPALEPVVGEPATFRNPIRLHRTIGIRSGVHEESSRMASAVLYHPTFRSYI